MIWRWCILFLDFAYLGAMAWLYNPVGAVIGGICSVISVLTLRQAWKQTHG